MSTFIRKIFLTSITLLMSVVTSDLYACIVEAYPNGYTTIFEPKDLRLHSQFDMGQSTWRPHGSAWLNIELAKVPHDPELMLDHFYYYGKYQPGSLVFGPYVSTLGAGMIYGTVHYGREMRIQSQSDTDRVAFEVKLTADAGHTFLGHQYVTQRDMEAMFESGHRYTTIQVSSDVARQDIEISILGFNPEIKNIDFDILSTVVTVAYNKPGVEIVPMDCN